MEQVPLFENPKQLTKKEQRLQDILRQIEEANLPSQRDYISLKPQTYTQIFSRLPQVKGEEIKDAELREFLSANNVKIESVDSRKGIMRNGWSTSRVVESRANDGKPLGGVPAPQHPPIKSGKDFAANDIED